MSCSKCYKFCFSYRISSPDDLTQVINIAHQAVQDGLLIELNKEYENYGLPSLEALASGKSWGDTVSHTLDCAHCQTSFKFGAETYHGAGGYWQPASETEFRNLYEEVIQHFASVALFTSEYEYNVKLRHSQTSIPPSPLTGFGILPDAEEIQYAKAIIGQPKTPPYELIYKILMSAKSNTTIERIYYCEFFELLIDERPKSVLIIEYNHSALPTLKETLPDDDIPSLIDLVDLIIDVNDFEEWNCHLSDICAYSIYEKSDKNLLLHNTTNNISNIKLNSEQQNIIFKLMFFILLVFSAFILVVLCLLQFVLSILIAIFFIPIKRQNIRIFK